jgi:flavorubredoxin/flavin reductase (DIM6/NTAB) family NADH-FMN oxidoreductase RutF
MHKDFNRYGGMNMYCTKQITSDLTWVGGNDRRLALFEGVYSVPDGVSYNSYLLTDDVTVLFDTVDHAVSKVFFENVAHVLNGRKLDYVVVQHMEPDHAGTLADLLLRYPEATVLCNKKTATMIQQFFDLDAEFKHRLVAEGDTFDTGHHVFTFVMAPMVHWPEVMVTYDTTEKILFSADAFGTFGALGGAIFADEVDFERDYMDEARRYYCNIVGKYGTQVQALLRKASALEIRMICPLHGFVWRKNLGDFIEKYVRWSTYTPEENGVLIAYASIYGNTENVAEILACRLRDRGIKTVVYDVSVTPASDIIAAAFKWSHLLFCSATYNAGVFVSMDELLRDLAAHNIQNRTVAFVENGSWAPTSGKLMREILAPCKNMTVLEESLTVKSSLKTAQLETVDTLVSAIAASMPAMDGIADTDAPSGTVDADAFSSISYGLFVLTAKDGDKDNGCIINTAAQLTSNPARISITVNKQNYTHDMILKTGIFNVSVLTQDADFDTFKHFGFQSGRDADKFAGFDGVQRSANGLYYLTENTNAFFSGKVIEAQDYGTHTLFIADVTEAKILSEAPSVTYAYYFDHIKPKPQALSEQKGGFVCKICGYVYEGDTLPADFICPLCKHGAEDFEPVK